MSSPHGEQGMGNLLNLCMLQLGVSKVQGDFWWLDIASWSVQRSWLGISRLKASWGYDINISWSWSWDKCLVAGEQLDWMCPKGPAAMLALRKWVGMDLSHSKEASLANTHAVKCHCWRWWNYFSPGQNSSVKILCRGNQADPARIYQEWNALVRDNYCENHVDGSSRESGSWEAQKVPSHTAIKGLFV